MRCRWEEIETDLNGSPKYVCGECRLVLYNLAGELTKAVEDKLPDCRGPVAVERDRTVQPTLRKRIPRFAMAMARWIEAGRPTRTDEEIQRIHDECCQPCKKFNAKKNTCRHCGCRVAKDGRAFRNKIAMATEHCPLRKW